MKFNIAAKLKNICDSLDIDTHKFKRREAPYNEALSNLLNSCTCILKQLNKALNVGLILINVQARAHFETTFIFIDVLKENQQFENWKELANSLIKGGIFYYFQLFSL